MNAQKFLALLKYDVFVAVLPLVAKMLTADAANTDPINLIAQWTQFQVAVIAAAPGLESQAFAALAQWVSSEVSKLVSAAAKQAGVSVPSAA